MTPAKRSSETPRITTPRVETPRVEMLEGRRLMSAALALTTDNRLLSFDTDDPGEITSSVRVNGLKKNETLLGIDFRPATGQLFGIGSSNRLYQINTRTGEANQIGGKFAVPLSGSSFDLDFNPTVDRIRVVSNADQNLRLNPNTGATVDGDAVTAGVQPDTSLAFAAGDANQGDDPMVVAAAYTNNLNGATTTTLYGIDSGQNALVGIGGLNGAPSPNGGQLFTIGALGVDVGRRTHLDIQTTNGGASNTAFAVLQLVGRNSPRLARIDLASGKATIVGKLDTPRNAQIADFALVPTTSKAVGFALTSKDELLAFRADEPDRILRRTKLKGLDRGEDLIGIDVRPATGELFGLSNFDRLYTIHPKNGRLTQIGDELAASIVGRRDGFGFDFNPTVDRIRVVSNADQNLRLNPITGAVVDADTVGGGLQLDGPLAYDVDTDGAGPDLGDVNAGADPMVTGSAYTNNVGGATTTTLYGIDTGLNVLVTQNPPNAGTINTVGALGVDVLTRSGFDIVTSDGGNNFAFAALKVDGEDRSALFSINLTSGAATRIGVLGTSRVITGLAFMPV
ncbi:MAG: DUF4394 domain-containing protein [Tepidisphaeraceae bacterium]